MDRTTKITFVAFIVVTIIIGVTTDISTGWMIGIGFVAAAVVAAVQTFWPRREKAAPKD